MPVHFHSLFFSLLLQGYFRRPYLFRYILPFSFADDFVPKRQVLCFFSLLFRSEFESEHLSLVPQRGALLFLMSIQTCRKSLEIITGVPNSSPFT